MRSSKSRAPWQIRCANTFLLLSTACTYIYIYANCPPTQKQLFVWLVWLARVFFLYLDNRLHTLQGSCCWQSWSRQNTVHQHMQKWIPENRLRDRLQNPDISLIPIQFPESLTAKFAGACLQLRTIKPLGMLTKLLKSGIESWCLILLESPVIESFEESKDIKSIRTMLFILPFLILQYIYLHIK